MLNLPELLALTVAVYVITRIWRIRNPGSTQRGYLPVRARSTTHRGD